MTDLPGKQCPEIPSPYPITQEHPLLIRSSVELFHFIETHHITESQAQSIFSLVVAAIWYLDSVGLVHGDIKDENIPIDENLNVKLTDFGSVATKSSDTFHGNNRLRIP
jgi:serine/threonine protein kinase